MAAREERAFVRAPSDRVRLHLRGMDVGIRERHVEIAAHDERPPAFWRSPVHASNWRRELELGREVLATVRDVDGRITGSFTSASTMRNPLSKAGCEHGVLRNVPRRKCRLTPRIALRAAVPVIPVLVEVVRGSGICACVALISWEAEHVGLPRRPIRGAARDEPVIHLRSRWRSSRRPLHPTRVAPK